MPRFFRQEVRTFFERQHDYSTRRGITHPRQDTRIVEGVRSSGDLDGRVLEVGGGSGYLLDALSRADGPRRLYNCELAYKAYGKQANNDIRLIGGDGLNLPFEGHSFDFVIMKNVLHHLVGSTPAESRTLAEGAIAECRRVVRDRGYCLIVEQYNECGICAGIVFWITRVLSGLGIGLKRLGLSQGVIVSFLTPKELEAMLIRSGMSLLVMEKEVILVPLIYKITILMRNVGLMLIIAQARGL